MTITKNFNLNLKDKKQEISEKSVMLGICVAILTASVVCEAADQNSVEELFSFEAPTLTQSSKEVSTQDEKIFYDGVLLNSVIEFLNIKTNQLLKENFSIDTTLAIVKSIYKYSYLNNRKVLDVNFAEWVLKDISS